ncbi:MAG: DUF2155 domain-containing protein [Caulobacterales bacterium]
MKRPLAALLFSLAAAFTSTSSSAASSAAVLRGLDKLTGHAKDFVAPVGSPVRFGALQVLVRSCEKAPPEETPEVSIYVEIRDLKAVDENGKPSKEKRLLFSGWMFASDPARNALEHAVYDVWAIDCRA